MKTFIKVCLTFMLFSITPHEIYKTEYSRYIDNALEGLKSIPAQLISVCCKKDNRICLSRPELQRVVERIEKEKNLNSLYRLWDIIKPKPYKDMPDIKLIKELSLFIVVIYKNLILYCNQDDKSVEDKINEINSLFDKVDVLTLREIVAIVHFLSSELPEILKNYELQSDLSWKAWFKKYWWAPPLILATIGIKLLLHHQAYHQLKKG